MQPKLACPLHPGLPPIILPLCLPSPSGALWNSSLRTPRNPFPWQQSEAFHCCWGGGAALFAGLVWFRSIMSLHLHGGSLPNLHGQGSAGDSGGLSLDDPTGLPSLRTAFSSLVYRTLATEPFWTLSHLPSHQVDPTLTVVLAELPSSASHPTEVIDFCPRSSPWEQVA